MSGIGRLLELGLYGAAFYGVGRYIILRLKNVTGFSIALKRMPNGYRLDVTWT
jgi:hypothetical protein